MKYREINWDIVSNMMKEYFPSDIPTNWKISNIIFKNYLAKNGNIRRRVSIKLASNTRNLKKYYWWVLLPKNTQKRVHGFEAKDGSGNRLDSNTHYLNVVNGELKENVDSPILALVEIQIPKLNTGESMTINLSYYIRNYATKISSGILSSKWKYVWSYKIVSQTQRIDHRLYLTSNTRFDKITSNITIEPFEFRFNNKKISILTERNPTPGSLLSGEIQYKLENKYSWALLNLISAGLIAILIRALFIGKLEFNLLDYILLFTTPVIIIGLTLLIARKFLPTSK